MNGRLQTFSYGGSKPKKAPNKDKNILHISVYVGFVQFLCIYSSFARYGVKCSNKTPHGEKGSHKEKKRAKKTPHGEKGSH